MTVTALETPSLHAVPEADTAEQAVARRQLSAVHRVPLAALRPADSPRTGRQDSAHLRLLAVSDATFPPILVHRPTMRVIDGTYRLKVAELRGQSEIEAQFFDGTAEEAFVLAVEANTGHGLPLTLAERTAAALRILRSHPQWSDRAVARVAGLSDKTVGSLRRRAPEGIGPAPARVGLDGRVRPLSTAEGRREAGRLLTESPGTSLRRIAQQAGISPATVRDVRDRLRRGEDPVPGRESATAPVRRAGRTPGEGAPVREVRPREPGRETAVREAAARERAARETAALFHNLTRDPALRHTETGRQILRLLGPGSLTDAQWRTLTDAVPAHRTRDVAALAEECADAWLEFARTLRGRSAVAR